MVVAGHGVDDFVGDGVCHCFVGELAGMEMVAAIESVGKGFGVGDAVHLCTIG